MHDDSGGDGDDNDGGDDGSDDIDGGDDDSVRGGGGGDGPRTDTDQLSCWPWLCLEQAGWARTPLCQPADTKY